LLAVVHFQNACANGARLDQFAKLSDFVCREHGAFLERHEDNFQVWLRLGPDGQPAEAVVHGHIVADFESQLVAIELESFFLIQDINRSVTETRDHDGSPGVGKLRNFDEYIRATRWVLLENCYQDRNLRFQIPKLNSKSVPVASGRQTG